MKFASNDPTDLRLLLAIALIVSIPWWIGIVQIAYWVAR